MTVRAETSLLFYVLDKELLHHHHHHHHDHPTNSGGDYLANTPPRPSSSNGMWRTVKRMSYVHGARKRSPVRSRFLMGTKGVLEEIDWGGVFRR